MAEYCVQCGADLDVYRLLDLAKQEQPMQHDKHHFSRVIFPITLSLLLLIMTILMSIIGFSMLTKLNALTANGTHRAHPPIQTIKYLEQEHLMMQQALTMMALQARENQILRTQVTTLREQQNRPQKRMAIAFPAELMTSSRIRYLLVPRS